MHAGVAIGPVILLTVFFGLMFVAGTVGMILFFAGRPGSGVRRVGGSLALVCGLMFGGLLVLGTMLFTVRTTEFHEQQIREHRHAELRKIGEQLHQEAVRQPREVVEREADAGLTRLPDPPTAPVNVSSAVPEAALTPNDDRTALTNSDSSTTLPSWTNHSETKQGDVTYVVLTSQQFATVDEARNQVAAEARSLLLQDFEKIYRTSAGSLQALPSQSIQSMAVRQEYVETVDRDFGNFYAPMHRVWWQVELSPTVRDSLFQMWKGQSQELRTLLVGGGLIGVTVLLAGVSLISRRRKAVPPPAPPPPSSAKASAVVLGVGAASLLAKRCRRWWKS